MPRRAGNSLGVKRIQRNASSECSVPSGAELALYYMHSLSARYASRSSLRVILTAVFLRYGFAITDTYLLYVRCLEDGHVEVSHSSELALNATRLATVGT
jgi:hypothetical protein